MKVWSVSGGRSSCAKIGGDFLKISTQKMSYNCASNFPISNIYNALHCTVFKFKVTHKDKGICVLKWNLQPLYSSHFCIRAYWFQLSGVLKGDVTRPFLYLATASELCWSITHAGIALEAEAGFNFSMTATSGVCQASARGGDQQTGEE